MQDRKGQQFGNYRLRRFLGRGGFAEVYLGEHIHLRSKAAVKVLYGPLSTEEAQRFLLEAQILASLEHTNIVGIKEFDIKYGIPFLVMHYAPNGTLRRLHPKGQCVPLITVVSYVLQIASALQFAHDRNIVHRDVKPENMLIDNNGKILLSDFGIAVLSSSTHSHSSKALAGTFTYMAPEQISSHFTPASDQYALGITVYEWLCGDPPFLGSASEITAKHLCAPPPLFRDKGIAIDPQVEDVVRRSLEKDPDQRFASIQAFALALQRSSQTLSHDSVSLSAIGFEASMSLSLSDITSGFTRKRLPPSPPIVSDPPPEISKPRSPLPSDNTPIIVQNPVYMPLPAQPDIVGPSGPSEPASPFLPENTAALAQNPMLTSTNTTQQLQSFTPHPPAIQTPHTPVSQQPPAIQTPHTSISPHPPLYPIVPPFGPTRNRKRSRRGFLIGGALTAAALGTCGVATYIAITMSTALYDLFRQAPGSPVSPAIPQIRIQNKVIEFKGSSGVRALAWSPNGKWIASCSSDNVVQVWNAGNADLLFTCNGHSGAVNTVACSPDGKYLVSGSDDTTVRVWNASDGSPILTYQDHFKEVSAVAWSPDGKRIVSCSHDNTARVWNANNASTIVEYRGHTKGLSSVAWSPDGKHIASGSSDMTVQVWQASDGKPLFIYKRHSDVVNALAWSPDGKRIASASGSFMGPPDRTVHVWKSAGGGSEYIYKGHSGVVNTLAWSPDSKRIASGAGVSSSEDNTVQIWNASDGSNASAYYGHPEIVRAVAWSPDGKRIASGSDDKTVQVFTML